jgi:hypothetical protein
MTAMVATMVATKVAVAVTKTMAAPTLGGGEIDNNQLFGEEEEMMASATVKATETATVTATKTMPTPTTEHQ